MGCGIAGTQTSEDCAAGKQGTGIHLISGSTNSQGLPCFAGARGGVFVGHFSIPKVGRCALKQLRFLSCSHGSSACLRTGNGAGLQTMSWILPSLKSLAEIPSTSYEVCVAEGATAEQNALPGQFNWRAWDCLVWWDMKGHTSWVGQVGCNKLHGFMPRGLIKPPC